MTFFDPCPKCQEAQRAAMRAAYDTPIEDATPIRLAHDESDAPATSCAWPKPSAPLWPKESAIDPFAGVHVPSPSDLARLMACQWDDDADFEVRMMRRQGARACRMFGVRPFPRRVDA